MASDVSAARAAFVKAVQSGNTGVAEYKLWVKADEAARHEFGTAEAAEQQRVRDLGTLHFELCAEAGRHLTSYPHLARGMTQPGDEEDWARRATEYAGREITRFEQYQELPKPPYFKVAIYPGPASPRSYMAEVSALAETP